MSRGASLIVNCLEAVVKKQRTTRLEMSMSEVLPECLVNPSFFELPTLVVLGTMQKCQKKITQADVIAQFPAHVQNKGSLAKTLVSYVDKSLSICLDDERQIHNYTQLFKKMKDKLYQALKVENPASIVPRSPRLGAQISNKKIKSPRVLELDDGIDIFKSIEFDSGTKFENIIKNSPFKLKKVNTLGYTPFMYAIKLGKNLHASIIQRYTKEWANNMDREDNNALHIAAMNGNADIMKNLVPNIDINSQNMSRMTPICIAAREGYDKCVKTLIDLGANFRIKGEFGYTPLHYAVASENITSVEILVRAGASIDSENDSGDTPITLARELENSALLTALGAPEEDSLEDKVPEYTARDVVKAIDGGDEATALFALQRTESAAIGNDPATGRTPLHAACEAGMTAVVRRLTALGADPEAVDHFGRTPLELCRDVRTRNHLAAVGSIRAMEASGRDFLDFC